MGGLKPVNPRLQQWHPLARGLVGAWEFNEPSGLYLKDQSGKGNDGTLVGPPLWAPGEAGWALSFSGSTKYVSIANASAFDVNDTTFSISGWFRSSSSTSNLAMVAKGAAPAAIGGYAVLLNYPSTGRVGVFTKDNAGSGLLSSVRNSASSSLNDNKWHFLTAVITTNTSTGSGNDIAIYIDGALNQGALTTGAPYGGTNSDNLALGARAVPSSPTSFFIGQLDDVRIYNRALSGAEVLQTYVEGPGGLFTPRRRLFLSAAPAGGPTYSLACDAGAVALTGIGANLRANRKLTASAGAVALTGVDANLRAARKVSTSAGAFTLTGVDANLHAGRKLATSAGAFTLTGVDATLGKSTTFAVDAGAFTLTGIAASLGASHKLAASAGSFALTGVDATLSKPAAAAGGAVTTLRYPRRAQPQDGTTLDTSNPLTQGLVLAIPKMQATSFSDVTGKAVAFTTTTGTVAPAATLAGVGVQEDSSNYGKYAVTLPSVSADSAFTVAWTSRTTGRASSGSYYIASSGAIGGFRIGLDTSNNMYLKVDYTTTDGAWTFGGVPADSRPHTWVVAFNGSSPVVFRDGVQQAVTQTASPAGTPVAATDFTLWGLSNGAYPVYGQHNSMLVWNRGLSAAEARQVSRAPYSVFARQRRFFTAGPGPASTLTCEAGAFTLTGVDAGLRAARKITPAAGAFALTGGSASLRVGRKITTGAGAFTLTGVDAGLSKTKRLAAGTGAFTLTGVDAGLRAGRKIAVGAGAFTLTGNGATIGKATKFSVGAGAFTLTGVDAGLHPGRGIVASAGAFTLTGNSVNLHPGTATYNFAVGAGAFVLTGYSAHVLQQQPSTFRPRLPLLGPPPNVRDILNPLWREWHRKLRMSITAPSSIAFNQTTVGAEVSSTATSGGYGAASAAEYDALVAQIAALRQALIDNGIAVP
jgi:hypothetical protein